MPIENLMYKAKELAKSSIAGTNWLQSAKEVAKSAASSSNQGGYVKLPALKLKPFALTGVKDDPAVIIVKALNELHVTNKLKDDRDPSKGFKSVFDAEIIESSDNINAPPGQYSIWMDYTVLENELKAYSADECEGKLTGQTFIIAAFGKVKKAKDPRQSFYPFKVLPPPPQ
jgi:hypothetical protein